MAVITDVHTTPAECERLAAMGLCCGALIRIVKPGRSCALQVDQTRLVLRGEHTKAIRVTRID
ncbi:hypothetical protein BH09SUM1_BH09SUM1_09450 [soil metagenome]